MATTTSPQDVASRLGRPLTTDEESTVAVLLADTERMISTRAGGLDSIDPGALVQVAASAVVRVLRNPEGYRSEGVGGVSYTIDSRVAAGFLTILDEEWALLGLTAPASRGGAFSFGPSLGLPRAGTWPGGDTWPPSLDVWRPWC